MRGVAWATSEAGRKLLRGAWWDAGRVDACCCCGTIAQGAREEPNARFSKSVSSVGVMACIPTD